jgi:hypothetical protein
LTVAVGYDVEIVAFDKLIESYFKILLLEVRMHNGEGSTLVLLTVDLLLQHSCGREFRRTC